MIQTLDPHSIRIPADHDRDLACDLSDLTASLAEIGQQVPVILREADGYELVCGARRLLACRALGLPVRAEIRDLDDEAAFVLRDAENRHRADISELDRARSYARALGAHYGGNEREMARRIGVSRGALRGLLLLARMPEGLTRALGRPETVRVHHARRLAPVFEHPRLAGTLADAAGLAGKPLVDHLLHRLTGLRAPVRARHYSRRAGAGIVKRLKMGRSIRLEFPTDISKSDLQFAISLFLNDFQPGGFN